MSLSERLQDVGSNRSQGIVLAVFGRKVGSRERGGGGEEGTDLNLGDLIVLRAHQAVLSTGDTVERAQGVGSFLPCNVGIHIAHEGVPDFHGTLPFQNVDPNGTSARMVRAGSGRPNALQTHSARE